MRRLIDGNYEVMWQYRMLHSTLR